MCEVTLEVMKQRQQQTLLIKIPQESTLGASVFEEVFSQLHETIRGEKIAFEIVASSQNVGFCVSGSRAATEIVAGQVYAIASDAEIAKIPDFTRKLGSSIRFVSSELSLAQKDLFPLKIFRDIDGDSLSGVLSVVAKCLPGEMAFIQIVISPKSDSWFHHLRLNLRRRSERLGHMFRVKYWFKRGFSDVFKKKIIEKTSGRLFEVNIRVATAATNQKIDPRTKLDALIGAMANFNTLDFNRFNFSRPRRLTDLRKFQERTLSKPFLLSTQELATLYHLPSEKEVPNIIHVLSRKHAPPAELPTDPKDPRISFFGHTNFRDQKVPFGIRRADRRRHLYVLGKSGSGKSKLLELLVQNDIRNGHGVGVLDPHGDLVDNILRIIPKERVKDVIIFDPSDLEFPPSFNPLEQVPEALKMRVTIGFIEIFKKLFGTNWSPRLEHVLRYTTLALLDTPELPSFPF